VLIYLFTIFQTCSDAVILSMDHPHKNKWCMVTIYCMLSMHAKKHPKSNDLLYGHYTPEGE